MRRTASTLSVLYLTAVLASCGEDPVRYVDPLIGASTNTDVAGGLLELTMGPEPAAWDG